MDMKRFVIIGVLISILYLIVPGLLFAGDKLAEAPVLDQAVAPVTAAETASIAPEPKPDPSGTSSGNAADVIGATAGAPTADDMKNLGANEPLAVKLADVIGHNRIAINIVWMLFCGFLVMFMQAGFALAETGFTQAKNAGHTMAMNFMIYAIGMLGYWICGFAIQMGGVGGVASLGGGTVLNGEFVINLFGKDFGLFGTKGFFLSGVTYDAVVFSIFLFQMVFMDTTATIPTGSMAERWTFKSFVVYGFFIAGIVYPLYANWVWGGGWLSQLGKNFALGHGHVDFAGSSVVHMTGGVAALAGAIVLGPRLGKFKADGTPNAIPGHHIPMALDRMFHSCFRLVRIQCRFYACRRRLKNRRCRRKHHARIGSRCFFIHDLHVDTLRQTGYLHDSKRLSGRPRCYHRTLRICEFGFGSYNRRYRRYSSLHQRVLCGAGAES